jgi:hypothetical protein
MCTDWLWICAVHCLPCTCFDVLSWETCHPSGYQTWEPSHWIKGRLNHSPIMQNFLFNLALRLRSYLQKRIWSHLLCTRESWRLQTLGGLCTHPAGAGLCVALLTTFLPKWVRLNLSLNHNKANTGSQSAILMTSLVVDFMKGYIQLKDEMNSCK